MLIREETSADIPLIRELNIKTFGTRAEADLVDALRRAGALSLSLIAVEGERILGHIGFSPVTVEGGGKLSFGYGLAPMAVDPDRRSAGIGSALVKAGLETLRAQGHGFVIVLGYPAFYSRFGFCSASHFNIFWERPAPEEAFMALELREGGLQGVRGIARFRPEFDEV